MVCWFAVCSEWETDIYMKIHFPPPRTGCYISSSCKSPFLFKSFIIFINIWTLLIHVHAGFYHICDNLFYNLESLVTDFGRYWAEGYRN